MPDITLDGLNGTNPLAFFAALGILAAVSDESADTRLLWRYAGSWRPVLTSSCPDIVALTTILDADRQSCVVDRALALEYDGKRDLKPRPERFHAFLAELSEQATATRRRSVDWASAFGTDVATDNNGNTKPTALHFTAGQQQFLQMVAELASKVTKDDLLEAIQGPWKYERPLPVMGWDATSSRDYALRASDPSTDKKLGVPGADWLAIRGLTFFPTAPRGNRVMTTGCVGGWKDGQFRWPLWTVPLSVPVVRSVVSQVWSEKTAIERTARGIGAIFSSGIKRSDQGGYGSFEPADVI